MGFQGEVERFFQQVWDTICAALPVDESIIDQESRSIVHNEDKGIWVGEFAVPLAHPVNGQSKVADFRELTGGYSDLFKIIVRYEMCTDQTGEYLAVSESKFELRVHTAPGIRFEYSRKNTSAPKAHIHYTGVAGIISPALMRNFADTKDPKKKGHLEKVHMPVGGQRFRPCLEDFLYFIIRECGFVGLHGWENRLRDFKKLWLDTQLRAAVRDAPEVAAETLEQLGYSITRPETSTDCLEHRPNMTW